MPQIFIVGAPRSGTTIISHALQQLWPISRFSEGHLMGFMAEMWSVMEEKFRDLPAREFEEMLVAQLEPVDIRRGYARFVRGLFESAYGSTDILDKSPGHKSVHAVPFALEVFPKARIIFCYRRALENVASRLRKWPSVPFTAHCQEWVAIMKTWRSLRSTLPSQQWFEVDQLDIAKHSKEIACRLGKWLNLGEAQVKAMHACFSEQRASMINGSFPKRVLDIEQIEWPNQQKQEFLKICHSEMQEWSYTLDASYSIDHQSGQGV